MLNVRAAAYHSSINDTVTTCTRTILSLECLHLHQHRCVRIKRRNQTFFITTTNSSRISSVKSQISEALSRETIPENMKLFLSKDGTRELPDIASVADHESSIRDDCVLYLVFREGGNSWESIDVMEVMAEEDE